MSPSRPFILRPVATSLLMLAIVLAGLVGWRFLPLSALPQVDYPTIQVQTLYPGASPEVMAQTVTAPLERQFGQMPGLTRMSSTSASGVSIVTLQFGLGLALDVAEQQVQAAINAGGSLLPADLPAPPVYAKVNPADAPVLALAITSDTLPLTEVQNIVNTRLALKISQVSGVGLVTLSGGQRPAMRIQADTRALASYGLTLDGIRTAITAANANSAKGSIDGPTRAYTLNANDQLLSVKAYQALIVAFRNGAAVRVRDVANVVESAENVKLGAWAGVDGVLKPAIILNVQRQPGANVIATVDAIKQRLPELTAGLPAAMKVEVLTDRTTGIRASVHHVQIELLLAVVLVVLVIFAFLHSVRATVIASLAVPISLIGTLGVMYLLGYSLNNLSLMALTVATGFVVDDAIVVLENTSRHIEAGMDRMKAALLGAREVGFTVLSISLSLVAVFIPLLFMGGQVGRLFREFAVTLSVAVMISLVISLTTTPMMCAWLLRPAKPGAKPPGKLARWAERGVGGMQRAYEHSLDWALGARWLVLVILVAVMGLNVWLFMVAPKGFFPQQDSGQISGGLRADQSISFQAMQEKMRTIVNIIRRDPAVDTVVGFTGGSRAGGGFMFVNLKPLSERKEGGQAVIARLRPQLAQVTGLSVFLNPVQDLRMGGRSASSTYQYTLKSDNATDLKRQATRLAEAMKAQPALVDVDTDQQENGVEAYVEVDKQSAARLGITARDINNALYNGFGQRQVATIYGELNQYRVIMGVAPQYIRSPEALKDNYVPARGATTVSASAGTTGTASSAINPALRDQATGQAVSSAATTMVPLAAIARFSERPTPSSVNHQDAELATTISYNLAEGVTLADGQAAVRQAEADIAMPNNVRGSFQGTARAAQQSQQEQPLLILAAIVVIYLLLGVLYESLVHPVTVLSTLPSAGVGAVLALLLFKMELSIIALIGLFLLIGIVKKNAILIIDFALDAERERGLTPLAAVREACLLRFRPILMTTLAAILGALPLAIGFGEGAELRRPLGIAIIGGLVASQVLTLLTTPVVYLLMDKLRRRSPLERQLGHHGDTPAANPT